MYRSVFALIIIAAMSSVLIVAACSKKLPSAPATPPGTPVALAHLDLRINDSRQVNLQGWVLNRSGFPIYTVRVAMKVYRDDPFFAFVTDTSDFAISTIANGDSAQFPTFTMSGDEYVDSYAVYSYLPPGP